ncbi:hypothetical protein SAMN05216338_108314 [Bradyrhizobium sp. Rc2d]|nr:hypothetical protein SAMN05216338_108314 [Bradyrhizobium sp. Rc2d]
MVLQGLAPGMEDGGHAELGAKMLGVGRDGGERLGRGAEQDGVDHRLVLEAISPAGTGKVKTTWKYGTGRSSACRSAAAPWHFGQCRLRQEL